MLCLLSWVICCVVAAEVGGLSSPPTPAPTSTHTWEQRGETRRWIVELEVAAADIAALVAPALDPAVAQAKTGDVTDRIARERAPIFARFEKAGVVVRDSYWIVEACAVDASAEQVEQLRKDPAVRRVWPDEVVYPASVVPIRSSTNSKNHATDLVQARGVTGKGAVIAVLDTGVDASHGNDRRPHRCFFKGGDVRDTSGPGLGGSRLLVNRQAGKIAAENALTHGTLVAGVATAADWGTAAADNGHAPDALVASYSVVDDVTGAASYASILQGWQLVLVDVPVLKTQVVLFPFAGSPDPLHPTQVALDRAVTSADLVVVVAAGNGGASSRSSQAAVNGIPVGAVLGQGQRVMWDSSTRGPLAALPQGIYPLMVANGVAVVGPLSDVETADFKDSGTSLAAAQVAGAATWLRGHRPGLTALEVKALLVATLEDVAPFNRTPPFDTRDAFGLGYLREDALLDAANTQGSGVYSSTLDAVQLSRSFSLTTAAGGTWSLACVWNRMDTASVKFSDLVLEVWSGSQLLARSDEPQTNVEALRFRAPRAEKLELRVSGKTLDAATVPFALAISKADLPYTPGQLLTYGKACVGTRRDQDPFLFLPASARTAMQASRCNYFTSNLAQRTQVLFDASLLPNSFTADGLALRVDEVAPSTPILDYSIEAEGSVGIATSPARAASPIFASNVRSASVVFAKRRLKLPDNVSGNRDASAFSVRIPFDRPFSFVATATSHLLVDAKVESSGARVFHYVDAIDASNPESSGVALVHAIGSAATTGSLFLNYGPVLAFTRLSTTGRLAPQHWGVGQPDLGAHYSLEYADVPASAIVVNFFGFSRTTWLQLPLPFDMAVFGAASCFLWTGFDFSIPSVASSTGHGSLALTLPTERSLIGAELFSQIAVFDAAANRLGMSFSGGVALRIGG